MDAFIRQSRSLTYLPGSRTIRFRPVPLAAFFVLSFILIILGFDTAPPSIFPHSDKLYHFLAFGAASGLSCACLESRLAGQSSVRNVITGETLHRLAGAAWISLSFTSELAQHLFTSRSFQWGDILANLLGSALGITVARELDRRRHKKAELESYHDAIALDVEDELDEELDDEEEDGEDLAGRARA